MATPRVAGWGEGLCAAGLMVRDCGRGARGRTGKPHTRRSPQPRTDPRTNSGHGAKRRTAQVSTTGLRSGSSQSSTCGNWSKGRQHRREMHRFARHWPSSSAERMPTAKASSTPGPFAHPSKRSCHSKKPRSSVCRPILRSRDRAEPWATAFQAPLSPHTRKVGMMRAFAPRMGIDVAKRKPDASHAGPSRQGQTRTVRQPACGHRAVAPLIEPARCPLLIPVAAVVNPARDKGFAQSQMVRNKADCSDATQLARICSVVRPEAGSPHQFRCAKSAAWSTVCRWSMTCNGRSAKGWKPMLAMRRWPHPSTRTWSGSNPVSDCSEARSSVPQSSMRMRSC
jgi:hypothetical protein